VDVNDILENDPFREITKNIETIHLKNISSRIENPNLNHPFKEIEIQKE